MGLFLLIFVVMSMDKYADYGLEEDVNQEKS